MLLIKYKPVFKVELIGEQIGYVNSQKMIEETIQDYLNSKEENIAYIIADNLPNYEFRLVDRNTQTNDEDILLAVKDQSTIKYRSFAIKLDGEIKEQVKTMEEAELVVNQIKEEYGKDLELDLTIEEMFTQNNPNEEFVEAEFATADIGEVLTTRIEAKRAEEEALAKKVAAQKAANEAMEEKIESLNGMEFSRPLSVGSISSRFGERSSIRSSVHTGLDIAAPYGTPVNPIYPGTVTFAGYQGSYGNLVIVSHGNGVESYYGHCSEIYVSAGESVDTSTTISAVGSTGNSTGNHLHLEIRKDGTPLNPQRFLYR